LQPKTIKRQLDLFDKSGSYFAHVTGCVARL